MSATVKWLKEVQRANMIYAQGFHRNGGAARSASCELAAGVRSPALDGASAGCRARILLAGGDGDGSAREARDCDRSGRVCAAAVAELTARVCSPAFGGPAGGD